MYLSIQWILLLFLPRKHHVYEQDSPKFLNVYTWQVTKLEQKLRENEAKLEAKEAELQRAQAEVDYIFLSYSYKSLLYGSLHGVRTYVYSYVYPCIAMAKKLATAIICLEMV